MKRTVVLLLLTLAACLPSLAQKTMVYAHRPSGDLRMDFYQPEHPREDGACVVYVFGGGFCMGERNDTASVEACQALANAGFRVASIDYRLGLRGILIDTAHILKAYKIIGNAISMAAEDCSEAVAYLCNHAEELQIDATKIILTGSSAGAITVLQTDFCRANGMPETATLPADFIPAAVIPYSGAVFVDHRKLNYATPPAPTCFFHGELDRIVNYKRLHASLRSSLNGAHRVQKVFEREHYSHWIIRFPSHGHEVCSYLPYTIGEFTAFVDASLAGRNMCYDVVLEDENLKPSYLTHMGLIAFIRTYMN